MEMKEVIARINELAAKNKTVGLTEEELVQQKTARADGRIEKFNKKYGVESK